MTTNGKQLAVQQPQRAQVTAGSRGLRLNNIEEMWRFAEAVSRSGIAPRGLQKPEQILIALEFGAELGLKPMQALATVMVVNGRATLWGDGMLAVAQASGFLEDIKETISGSGDKMAATCQVKRKGRPTPTVATFTWDNAKQAGLTSSDTYKKYPQRMLKARARAFALRDAFPDVLCGVMSTDEAHDLPENLGPVFVDGAEQPPDDLESLVASVEVTEADDDPLGVEGDDGYLSGFQGPPTEEELARAERE